MAATKLILDNGAKGGGRAGRVQQIPSDTVNEMRQVGAVEGDRRCHALSLSLSLSTLLPRRDYPKKTLPGSSGPGIRGVTAVKQSTKLK